MQCAQCKYWAHAKCSGDSSSGSKAKYFVCPRCEESKRTSKEDEQASQKSEAVGKLCYLGDIITAEDGADGRDMQWLEGVKTEATQLEDISGT